MKSAGIQAIAERVGVSMSTVSRALNHTGQISSQRAAEIFRIANELGYAPRTAGRTIAVILPESDIELRWYSINLLNAIRQEAAERGRPLEIVSSDQLHVLDERSLVGMLSFDFSRQLAERIGRSNAVPLVCINDSARHIDQVYSVFSDEDQAMSLAVGHLAGFGHRRIGLILNGTLSDYCNSTRKVAFERELARFNLENREEFIVHPGDIRWKLHGSVRQLLDAGVTAMISTGESRSASVQNSLRYCGIKVPEEVSLIGWEMAEVSEYLDPPQTTIGQDFQALARCALNILECRIDGGQVGRDTLVPCRLNERASVAMPPRN